MYNPFEENQITATINNESMVYPNLYELCAELMYHESENDFSTFTLNSKYKDECKIEVYPNGTYYLIEN